MTTLLNETFDTAVGYDVTWGEVVGSGGTCDEDFSAAGLGQGFSGQCLRIVRAGADVITDWGTSLSANTTYYFRAVVIIHAQSVPGFSNGKLWGLTHYSDTTNSMVGWGIANDSGTFHLCTLATGSVSTSTVLALDTPYLMEMSYNPSTKAYEFKLDGTTVRTGTSTTGQTSVQAVRLGGWTSTFDGEVYYDNIAVGDDGFFGWPAAAAVDQPARKRWGGVPHMALNRGVW